MVIANSPDRYFVGMQLEKLKLRHPTRQQGGLGFDPIGLNQLRFRQAN
jgi:hypothetical protein